jgi:hypothetical protein
MANSKKNPRIVSLRTLRKASHITGKVAKKGSGLMDKVERRTTRLILEQTGSASGHDNVSFDHLYYDRFPFIFPVHPALPTLGQKPSVTVFAFLDPKGFYGGIATLLLSSATLANKLGYDFRIAQTTGYSDKNDVLKFLADNGIVIEKHRYSTLDLSRRNVGEYAYLPLHPEDVVMVSAWWDAHIASQLPLQRKFVYLIQDFEPIFYNNSDEYVLADATYHTSKFIPLCNTQLLYQYFAKNGYNYVEQNATWFEPAPAPKIAEPKIKAPDTPKKLFLYGRPAVHRNLYMSALQALDIAFSDSRLSHQSWELYSAGSANVASIKLNSGRIIQSMGKMDLDAYYAWAQTIDVAVSPMLAPHPNYPTLELAALGATVVTTKWETKQTLEMYSKNILMAEPSAEDMAEKIIAAALMDPAEKKRNQKQTTINTDWTKALDSPLSAIIKKLQ